MAKHKRLKPIGDYLYDKGEMVEQMFSSIPIVEIRNMVPISLQGMPLHELKAECLVELLGISDREILNIVDGKKERNVSSSDSEREGAFIISDDERKIPERKIKKEKKDVARKIKTERISSKKDGNKKSPEPSTSKKKRKSKEIVDVNSKKKKSDDKTVSIPSSSRDASKVAVSRKKKDKKDEKKKEYTKKNEEDEIVVLDDDSDKEEKREQKTLLDLLELEMRARAIRSLLKKEETVQAQKILSEYKDEPDDLIPIEIEPPQIELLSDSEEEETTNTTEHDAHKNAGTETKSEGLPSEQTGDSLHSSEDQVCRSPPNKPIDAPSIVSRDVEKDASRSDRIEIISGSTSKTTTKTEGESVKSDSSESSQPVMKECKENDTVSECNVLDDSIHSGGSDDKISAKVGELADSSASAPQFSLVTKQSTSSCGPKSQTDVRDSIDLNVRKSTSSLGLKEGEHNLSSNKDSRKEIDINHFLVIEGPSVVQVPDGSQEDFSAEMNKPIIETTIPPSRLCRNEDKIIESGEMADCLMVQEEFQQPTVTNSNVADENYSVETPGTRFVVPSPEEDGASCEAHFKRFSGCLDTSGENSASQVSAERRTSTDRRRTVEDEFSSQFEDEVLDYDYNPVNSCCGNVNEGPFPQSENSPSCTADYKALSSESNCSGIHNSASFIHTNTSDNKDTDRNEFECSLNQASDDCGVSKPDASSNTIADRSENSCEDRFHSSGDSPSVSKCEEKLLPDSNCLTSHIAEGVLSDDSYKDSSLRAPVSRLETVKLKDDIRIKEFSSSELLTISEPGALSEAAVLTNSVQGNSGSGGPKDNLTKSEYDPHTPPNNGSIGPKDNLTINEYDPHTPPHVEATLSLDADEHISSNTKPPCFADSDEFTTEREASEEEAGCSEQHQVTTERAVHVPGCAQSEALGKDDPLAVEEEDISSIVDDHAFPSNVEDTPNFDACERICSNTEPCLADNYEFSKKEREVSKEGAGYSEQHQMTIEKAVHFPGCARNEAPRKDPVAVEKAISNIALPSNVEETRSLYASEHICLNTKTCLADNDKLSKNERAVSVEEDGCSEQHTEQAVHFPGFSSTCAQNESPKEDDPVAVEEEEDISSIYEDRALPSRGLCVTASVDSNYPMIQQTSAIIYAEQDERQMLSRPCQSFISSDNDVDVALPTVMCEQKTSEDFEITNTSVGHLSPKTSDATQEDQSFDPLVLPLDVDVVEELQLSGTHVSKSGEVQNSHSQDLNNIDVVEIIDITEGENLDSSEVVYVSEERVDPDSLDGSDNEISDKAALILEHMNTILNVDADGLGDSSSSESCHPSPDATIEVPAVVYTLNSGSFKRAYDDEIEDTRSPENKGHNFVVEISDADDANGEETSGSNDEGASDSNDDCSGGSNHKGTIEIIDDSESSSSVESQHDGSKSDDCVMVLQPEGSISDDCIIVTEYERSTDSNDVVLAEQDGSDDCAIVSQLIDPIAGEPAEVSSCEVVPVVEAPASISVENTPTAVNKESVMVTIIIEDDDGEEEEVQLMTEEVPAEILELKDDDEVKSNWTARWLESDNVKKVVQTSKILANVRKQMKMKLKKLEAPTVNDPKPPEEKSAPPLIGSVEEYHRLVEEGVIFSKITQKDETLDGPDNLIRDSINPSKESSESVCLDSKDKEGCEEKSHRKKNDKKKSEKLERKKKSEKSVRRKKCDGNQTTYSDMFVLDRSVRAFSSCAYETETSSKVNQALPAKTDGADVDQEDGEIVDSGKSKASYDTESQIHETKTNGQSMSRVADDKICHKEQTTKTSADGEEREEGETSEKEEGEISDSDEDSKESQKSSQPKPSSSLKLASGSKESSRSVSSPSCIPLPQKPPVKQQLTKNPVKQQSNKTPERNSAAKRLILRNLQLGKKRPANSKNKKKRKKGAGRGNKKGLGYSSSVAPMKSKPTPPSQRKDIYKLPPSQTEVSSSLASASGSIQTVEGIQPSYLTTYPRVVQPESGLTQLGQAQNSHVNGSSAAQMYDSYYSWAYSQGLIRSADGNYGYGTPESTPDPNVYRQWEEYYRKLMEACKVSADHASAGTLYNVSSTATEKSGYTWVFEHSNSATQPNQMQTSADSTAEPAAQVPLAIVSSDVSHSSESDQNIAHVTNEMSEKDRFESWQYRYGLKGLLKEHFIPAPTAPSTGDGNQKS